MEFLNPIAELDKADSGKIIRPEEAYGMKNDHKFFCPDCDCLDDERILIPSKSSRNNFFFKHKGNCGHEINPETLLHKLAVKWFENKTIFEIPSHSFSGKKIKEQIVNLNPSKTKLEYRKLKRIIPDVKITTLTEFEFAIEIIVTSDLTETKLKLIDQFNLPTIRLDLSEFYENNSEKCRIDFNFVNQNLDALLTNIDLKSWAIEPKEPEVENKIEVSQVDENGKIVDWVTWVTGVVLVGFLVKKVGAFFIRFFNNSKRKKKNPRRKKRP